MTEKELRYHWLYMDLAIRMSQMSHCVRKKVGAVIVKNDNIISYGWNGMPAGYDNVCELDPDTTNPLVLHAEKNALKKLIRSTESSVGATMYVTMCTCQHCAIDVVDAHLARVFYLESYRTSGGLETLEKAGIEAYCLSAYKGN